MSWINKPLWSEGLFIKPVHFQQQERYLEHTIGQGLHALHGFPWGLQELTIDNELLNLGKFGLTSARGIMPDGQPFSLPEDAPLPTPIDIEEGIIDQIVYLCLPLKSLNREITHDIEDAGIFRYRSKQIELQDTTSTAARADQVHVSQNNFRLMLDSGKRSDFSCVGVAHIQERNKDHQVILNRRYIEPCLDCTANASLKRYITEISGLLEHRSTNLAARLSSTGTGGAGEVADFLMLQTINRNLPLFRHLTELPRLHPEDLYRQLVQLSGEMCTFFDPRTVQRFPAYQHDKMADSFDSVIATLKEQLATIIDARAINLPLKEPRYGIYRSVIQDPQLLEKSNFYLAIKADMSSEELRRAIPNQIKITSVEKIRDLIMQQLPGVPVQPLPVAPRQLPYHQGFIYFELDRNNPAFNELRQSSAVAFHISGNYTGLEMEFWAVKS